MAPANAKAERRPAAGRAALPVLYSFRRCPFAMRARMALWTAGVTAELREVSLKAKPQAMIAASPKASVPVLVLPNGDVLEESLDIMTWALERNDPENWLAPDIGDRTAMDALVRRIDGPFKHDLDRYKYATRYEGADPIKHRQAAQEILDEVTAPLRQTRFLFGDRPSYADIAIFPFVRQYRIADPHWFDALDRPGLHPWLQRLMTSDLFSAIMTKHKFWTSGDPMVAWGRGVAHYSPNEPAAPGNTTGLSEPSFATDDTPKK